MLAPGKAEAAEDVPTDAAMCFGSFGDGTNA